MANERLRAALLEQGITTGALAAAIDVDEKTVERWITKGRTPYRRHRYAVASHLKLDEGYLWPDALSRDVVTSASESEIVTVFPHRWSISREVWGRLFASAEEEIGVLAYGGLQLAEDSGIQRTFAEKARAGVRVRILLGDPDSREVAERGHDEGIGEAMAAKVRNAIVRYQPLLSLESAEVRLHRTILYNSIYRADDQLLVNTHVYGFGATDAPVFHLRKIVGGDLVNTYLESFERVWETATPLNGD